MSHDINETKKKHMLSMKICSSSNHVVTLKIKNTYVINDEMYIPMLR